MTREDKRARNRRGDDALLPDELRGAIGVQRWPRQRRIVLSRENSAPDAIGTLEHGCEIVGVNKGQFGLGELLAATLEQTGPAEVDLATWTITTDRARMLRRLMDSGLITRLRLVLDRSFRSRNDTECEVVVGLLGNDSIRTTRCHAKMTAVINPSWAVCLRGSMNLTADPRLEQWDLSEDREVCDWWRSIVDELYARPASSNWESDLSQEFLDVPAVAAFDLPADPVRLTQAEVARRYGISPQSVGKMVSRGTLTLDAAGTISIEEADRQYGSRRQRIDRQPEAMGGGGHEDDDGESYYAARTRNERLEADERELRVRKLRGELVDVSAASMLWASLAAQVREQVVGIGAGLSASAVSIAIGRRDDPAAAAAEIEAEYNRLVRRALQRLDTPPRVS